MKGRRTAAMLCVLLGHALVVLALLNRTPPHARTAAPGQEEFVSQLLYIVPDIDDGPLFEREALMRRYSEPPSARPSAPSLPSDSTAGIAAGETAASAAPGYTDWPLEGKEAARRVLAAEAESERVARMFAGPGGTWASLTKRQRSQLNKFRWKKGVEGLKYDEKGNAIYELPNGCTIVNLAFFGCPIGVKPKVHGDMFDNMREYFDEQRLPQTDEGNGTEPEARRPAN